MVARRLVLRSTSADNVVAIVARLIGQPQGSRLVLFPRSRAAPPDEDLMSDIELINVPTERRESAFGRDSALRISFPAASESSPICECALARARSSCGADVYRFFPLFRSACVGEGEVYTAISEGIGHGPCCVIYVETVICVQYVRVNFRPAFAWYRLYRGLCVSQTTRLTPSAVDVASHEALFGPL